MSTALATVSSNTGLQFAEDLPTLTTEIIKQLFCVNATAAELMYAVHFCQVTGLNPYLKEVHFVKYGEKMQTIVSYDTFMKIADKNPNYKGFEEDELIVSTEKIRIGKKEFPEIIAKCKVHRKDREYPFVGISYFSEACQTDKYGDVNSKWAKSPKFMTRKCAISQAFRFAFPKDFSQVYIQDEMPENEIHEASYTVDNSNYVTPEGKHTVIEEKKVTVLPERMSEIESLIMSSANLEELKTNWATLKTEPFSEEQKKEVQKYYKARQKQIKDAEAPKPEVAPKETQTSDPQAKRLLPNPELIERISTYYHKGDEFVAIYNEVLQKMGKSELDKLNTPQLEILHLKMENNLPEEERIPL